MVNYNSLNQQQRWVLLPKIEEEVRVARREFAEGKIQKDADEALENKKLGEEMALQGKKVEETGVHAQEARNGLVCAKLGALLASPSKKEAAYALKTLAELADYYPNEARAAGERFKFFYGSKKELWETHSFIHLDLEKLVLDRIRETGSEETIRAEKIRKTFASLEKRDGYGDDGRQKNRLEKGWKEVEETWRQKDANLIFSGAKVLGKKEKAQEIERMLIAAFEDYKREVLFGRVMCAFAKRFFCNYAKTITGEYKKRTQLQEGEHLELYLFLRKELNFTGLERAQLEGLIKKPKSGSFSNYVAYGIKKYVSDEKAREEMLFANINHKEFRLRILGKDLAEEYAKGDSREKHRIMRQMRKIANERGTGVFLKKSRIIK